MSQNQAMHDPSRNAGAAYPFQNQNPDNALRSKRWLYFYIIFFGINIFLLGFVIFRINSMPRFPEGYINTLSVSNFNVSNDNLTGKWDIQLQLRNPNSKTSFHYKDVVFNLYYRSEPLLYNKLSRPDPGLAYTSIPPFDLVKGTETLVNATLSVSGIYIEGRLDDSIENERVMKGSVDFNLWMFSSVTYWDGLFRTSESSTVHCDDVAVGVSTSSSFGMMLGLSKRCKYPE